MKSFKNFLMEMPVQNNTRKDSFVPAFSRTDRPANPFKYKYHGSFVSSRDNKRYFVTSHTNHRLEYNPNTGSVEAIPLRNYFVHTTGKNPIKPIAHLQLADMGSGSHDVKWVESGAKFGIHHLYKHILGNDSRVKELTSGSQSPGAIKAWRELNQDKDHDVFIRKNGEPTKLPNFDDYYKQPHTANHIIVKRK